jgi:hypothetical protein
MTKLGVTAFCVGMLALAGCSQVPTSTSKAPPDKAGTVQTTPPPSIPTSGYGDHGDGGGGGGY